MNPSDLRHIGTFLYGGGWQTALASDLGVGLRSVQRWSSGSGGIPDGVANEIYWLAAEVQASRALDVIQSCRPKPKKIELKLKPSGNVKSMHDRPWSVEADREILTRLADLLGLAGYAATVKSG